MRAVLAGLIMAAAPLGCALIMDLSTDGYHLAPGSRVTDGASSCDAEAGCSGLVLECASAADCDAGAVCCLTVLSLSSASVACQSGASCGDAGGSIQLCKSDGECGGTTCITQSCPFGGATVTIQACGAVALCSP